MDLLEKLMNELGLSEEQAVGGAGLLFKLAREKIDPSDFAKIAGLLPMLNEWISKAPEGSLMKSLGGFASVLGGKGSDMGLLAQVAGGFSQLGISKDKITPFVKLLGGHLQELGGDEVGDLIQKYMMPGR